jgi:hypothetical protein
MTLIQTKLPLGVSFISVLEVLQVLITPRADLIPNPRVHCDSHSEPLAYSSYNETPLYRPVICPMYQISIRAIRNRHLN